MTATAYPIQQLRQIAVEFRHLRSEYKREGEHGRTRRDIGTRLDTFEQRFQTLLDHWVSDEAAREAWREHFYRGGSEPEDDLVQTPLVYMGRSDAGSEIRIYPGSDGTFDIMVDGTRANRAPATLTFPAQGTAQILGQEWKEFTTASLEAISALKDHCATAKGTPPWQWARELFAAGLIDINFSLTPRGRRLIHGH